ncbi:MAG: HlyD family efflux transporter periplasmic adaptor subunit, partial [Gammaproteobacteria bacterium]|nr:HlyD family efflux transporter periplasmic adaptor subunit [Gammaproteobacteria bacterium]
MPDSKSFKLKVCCLGVLLLVMSSANSMARDHGMLFSGQVFSRQAQEIFVPLTNNWQARISMMLTEGAEVKPGNLVVEFDGGEVARQLEQQLVTQRTEQAKTERDIALLEKELVAAEFALKQAGVVLALAVLRADIPEGLIGALEHSENQLSKEKAIKAVEDAKEQLKDKQKSIEERHRQASLDKQKSDNQLELWNQMLESFSIYAEQPGFVIYGKHPWNRTKFQEGDTVQTSFRVAQIADTSDLAVHIWINSVDRPRISTGTEVMIKLDALPGIQLEGRLDSISDSGSKRSEWGEAVYYQGVVLFESGDLPNMLPGM